MLLAEAPPHPHAYSTPLTTPPGLLRQAYRKIWANYGEHPREVDAQIGKANLAAEREHTAIETTPGDFGHFSRKVPETPQIGACPCLFDYDESGSKRTKNPAKPWFHDPGPESAEPVAIRMVRTFDVAAVRTRVDRLAGERRALEAEIQAINWTVDLS